MVLRNILPSLSCGMVLLTYLNYIVRVLKALCGPEEYLALPHLGDGTPDLPELHCTSLEGPVWS